MWKLLGGNPRSRIDDAETHFTVESFGADRDAAEFAPLRRQIRRLLIQQTECGPDAEVADHLLAIGAVLQLEEGVARGQ